MITLPIPPGHTRRPASPIPEVKAKPAPDGFPLLSYAGFIRRQWLIMAVLAFVGLVLGQVRTMVLVSPTYTATVAVLAPPVPLHSGLPNTSPLTAPLDAAAKRRPRDTTMDTETQLVHSAEVLRRLGTFAGFRVGRAELRRRISMRVPPNTRVLTIMVRAPTPIAARDGADSVAEAYLTLREEILGGIQQRNREGLLRRQNLLRQQLLALPGDPNELTRLTVRTRRQAVTREISEVQRQLTILEGTAIQPGEVVRGASIPTLPDDPGREVSRTTGAGLGLLAGLVLGLLRDRRPRRLRSPAEVRGAVALPVLAEVREGAEPDDGITSWRNAFRRLRNLVQERDARTILVTGVPSAAEAVRLAHGLAGLCAEGGTDVAVLRIGPPVPGEPASEAYLLITVNDDEEDRVVTATVEAARRDAQVIIVTGVPLAGADSVASAIHCDLSVLTVDVVRVVDRELTEGVADLTKVEARPRGLVLITPAQQPRRGNLTRTGSPGSGNGRMLTRAGSGHKVT